MPSGWITNRSHSIKLLATAACKSSHVCKTMPNALDHSCCSSPQEADKPDCLLAGLAFVHSRPKDDLWHHNTKLLCSISVAIKVSCVQGDGGKFSCGLRYLLQDRPCLVYSLGSAGDTSFEEQILSRTSCQVERMPQAAASLAMPANPFW